MNPSTQTTSLQTSLIRLWRHLSKRRQIQFWLLMVLMFISAFVGVISLGAVLPFLGILIVPEKVFNHPIVSNLAPNFGVTSADQLVLPLTIAFAVVASKLVNLPACGVVRPIELLLMVPVLPPVKQTSTSLEICML